MNYFFNILLIFLIASSGIQADFNVDNVESENAIMATGNKFSTAQFLTEIIEEIEKLLQNIIHTIAKDEPEISESTEKMLSRLTSSISLTLRELSTKILEETELILIEIFEAMRLRIFNLKDEFLLLANNSEAQFEWAITQLNQTIMNHSEHIDNWTANVKNRLRYVNDTQLYQNGCRMVNDFVMLSSKKVKQCCDITIQPVYKLCLKARSMLAEALILLAEVMDRLQTCLEDKNSYLEYMIPCINIAFDDISALISKAMQLREEISHSLPIKILYSKSCIAIVWVQMAQYKDNLEADLEPFKNNSIKYIKP